MKSLRELPQEIDNMDMCGLLVLGLIVFFVGMKVVDGKQDMERGGFALGGLAFVTLLLIGAVRLDFSASDRWIAIALRAGLAAAIVTGLAWIVLPISAKLYAETIGALLTALNRRAKRIEEQIKEQKEELKKLQQKRREQADMLRHDANAEKTRRQRAADQQRRSRTRADLRMFYVQKERQIGDSYPRSEFEKFVSDFLSDSYSPEFVHEQASKLLKTLQECIEKNDRQPEQQQQRQREDADRARVREAVDLSRKHLAAFYQENETELRPLYPFRKLQAFLYSAIHDRLTVEEAWTVCMNHIAELKKLVDDQNEKQRQESAQRVPTAEQIAKAMQRNAELGLTPEQTAEEIAGFLRRNRPDRLTPDE